MKNNKLSPATLHLTWYDMGVVSLMVASLAAMIACLAGV